MNLDNMDQTHLLVYVSKITPRLKYIFKQLLGKLMGVEYKLCTQSEDFKAYAGPRMSYCDQQLEDELFVYSAKLLFEKGMIDQGETIQVIEWQDTKAFFTVPSRSCMPFDLFAASFFLLSRYEEYLPHKRDAYDRYNAEESIAFQQGFLHQPVVNKWTQHLQELLKQKYPELKHKKNNYKYISTIDIDNAFAYKEKGFMRTVGALGRSLLYLDFKELNQRARVLMGFEEDPYDTYEYQLSMMKQYDLEMIYFFLIGDYGENDKNVSIRNKKYQSLIKSLADYSKVGIHPSYASNSDNSRLGKEINTLTKILKREVVKSRQHFLKLKLPSTYRCLIDLDIKEDHTLGYASQVGFRAGICSPFYFYDLDREEETTLRIVPFAVMDATMRYYLKLKPEEAINTIIPLIKEVKSVNGTFVSLWHNESLGDKFPWTGWRQVYDDMVKFAVPD